MDSFIKVSDDNIFIDLEKNGSNLNSIDVKEFLEKIESKNLSIGIVGLGYAGLQLAVAFASYGFTVTGIEFDKAKVKKLNKAKSYISEVSDDHLSDLIKTDKFYAVSDLSILSEIDVVIVSDQIPSQYPKNKDLSYIMALFEKIVDSLDSTKLIILEQFVEPGTCADILYPLFEEQNKVIDKDYFLAVSPERVEAGNKKIKYSLIPRVVAGMTCASRQLAARLFKTIQNSIIEVSSPTVAETVKFFEISNRWVNQAFVNEMMTTCSRMGISVWEVINSVRSNPFDFFRYLPGPGIGETSQYNDEPFKLHSRKGFSKLKHDIIDKSIEINTLKSTKFVVDQITGLLNDRKKCLNESNILLVGIANKRNVAEWNESAAVDIIKELLSKKANIYYHDPYIDNLQLDSKGFSLTSIKLSEDMLKWIDMTVILMDHDQVDYGKIVEYSPIVLDFKYATKKIKQNRDNIVLL